MNYEHDSQHPLTAAYPYFPPEEQDWLTAELREIMNAQLSMGPRTAAFERGFAEFCGASHGIAFPNCTSALEAALRALGVGPGDEVLVPAQTFAATGMAVSLTGAKPVFTEVSEDTFSMDFADAWARAGERTRGAIVVHFGGLISPALPEFVRRMKEAGRFVLEDAAHAPGAELDGRRAGSFADGGCFSFYPTKVMTTGEGGMFVTSRDDLAATVRSLQNRGRDMGQKAELYALPGRNNRFTEIAAAMGLSQLRCLPGFLERRRRVAAIYDEALRRTALFSPLEGNSRSRSSYWRYVAMSPAPFDRAALRDRLAEDRISIDWAYDPPAHLQPVFREELGTQPGDLPRSEAMMARHICLPMHARLRDVDAELVGERLIHHARAIGMGGGTA